MSRAWLAAVFAASAVVAVAALVPLRVALEQTGAAQWGLSAAAVEGPVWGGRLIDARLAGAPVGDLDVALAPLPLLTGRLRLEIRGGAEGPLQRAVLVRRGAELRIESLEAAPEAAWLLQAAGFEAQGDAWVRAGG